MSHDRLLPSEQKNVYVKTLGCKVNTFDSHALEHQFKNNGYNLVAAEGDADIIVLNTCSVTSKSEKEARYLIRRHKRENPNSFQIVTGCYSQIDSANLAKMNEVDYIVPNEVKTQLVDLIEERIKSNKKNKMPEHVKAVSENRQSHFKSSLTLFDTPISDRSRAFLKIQDGCNGFCSYCQIPYARGASVSVDPEQVELRVDAILEQGVKEIVLTGIHIGDYGQDLQGTESGRALFLTLLEKILKKEKLKRLRISSLEPSEASVELISLLKKYEDKVCDHFHLPLQAGNNPILKAMNRQYTKEEYAATVDMIRSFFPRAHISADVIPGFPGETEELADETYAFIKELGINSLHVFPYSKRPNTAAIRMKNHIDPQRIKERAAKLRGLSQESYQEYSKNYIGRSEIVLWESFDEKIKRFRGKTRNYLNVVSRQFSEQDQPETMKGLIEEVVVKGFVGDQNLLAVKASLSS